LNPDITRARRFDWSPPAKCANLPPPMPAPASHRAKTLCACRWDQDIAAEVPDETALPPMK
jgi:hypothetical protein